MESLIGSKDGWYDGQGTFHEWTRESVDAIIDEYYQTLESIKNGTLYSKDSGDGDSYAMIPPSDDVECSYGTDFVREDGKSIHLGDYTSCLLRVFQKRKLNYYYPLTDKSPAFLIVNCPLIYFSSGQFTIDFLYRNRI